jgi:hypothetical protein
VLEQAGKRGLDSRTPTWQRDDHVARRRCWATPRRGLSKQALGEEQTALPIGLAALPKGTREAVSHLPVGVAPGKQTRRRRSRLHRFSRWLLVVIGVVVAASGLLGSADLISQLIGLPWHPVDYDWVVVTAAAVSGAVGVVLALLQDSVYWRCPALDVPVGINTSRLSRLECLRVRVEVDSLHLNGQRTADVGLVCLELSDARVSLGGKLRAEAPAIGLCWTMEETIFETWLPLTQHSTKVDFLVPPSGPCSYEGTHLSIAWAIRVRLSEGQETLERVLPVWVQP